MTENDTPKTRRAVLGAAAAAALAVATDAFIHPQTVAATTGTMIYGDTNNAGTSNTALHSASSETLTVDNTGTGNGLSASAAGLSAVAIYGLAQTGYGVIGDISIFTKGSGGIGVWGRDRDIPGKIGTAGTSYSGTGVVGFVAAGAGDTVPPAPAGMTGVYGYAPGGTGVVARSDAGTGVLGVSGNTIPAAKARTGVYGSATQDATSRGVWGYSPAGMGVYGESTGGRAVQGSATSGVGVRAAATSGYGVYASATTGIALLADGRVRLTKSAGQATIASGTASVSVTPGIDLTTTSAVIATLNGDAGGSTAVKRVAIDTTTNAFTIYLTANASASVKVAWLVLS